MMLKMMMTSRVRGSDPRIKSLMIIWLLRDQNIPGWILRVRGSDPRIKSVVIIWLFRDQNIPGWILSENPGTKKNVNSLVGGAPA